MKEVFILGAGASFASAATPLGSELVWQYHYDCARLVPIRDGIVDNTAANKDFANFEKFLVCVGHYYPELSLELERWRNRGEAFYTPSRNLGKTYYIDEILELIQAKGDADCVSIIRQLIFEHIVESSLNRKNELYGQFIRYILQPKSQDAVSIISFNFDCLLHEHFLHPVTFDYLINFSWIDPHRSRYRLGVPISLIKLNGSLDWGICNRCGKLNLYFWHMRHGFYNNKLCTSECGGKIDPFIVMPHQTYEEFLNPLWKMAEWELSRAEKITIIGYSFPDYDHRVINLFGNTVNENVKLEIIDYCEQNRDRLDAENSLKTQYKKMFPRLVNNININLDGFAEYLRKHVNA